MRYEQICFFVDDQARPLVERLHEAGEEEIIRYLANQFHAPGKHEILHEPQHCDLDDIYESGGYILAYTDDYVGLEYRLDA